MTPEQWKQPRAELSGTWVVALPTNEVKCATCNNAEEFGGEINDNGCCDLSRL
jgi:hypothetical protein